MSNNVTELVNKNSMNIDELSSADIVSLMVEEDRVIYQGVKQAMPDIARSIDLIVEQWKKGGRVFVVGAGTSGRLGVLDAAELGPTYSIDESRWIGIIAGGYEAMWKPLEEHEDDENLIDLLGAYNFCELDVVIGVTASGSTPYVLSAIKFANDIGGTTISISCNEGTISSELSDCGIEVVVGPEVIRGSTRLKAGTAQKTALNIISTGTMVRLGKVYKNQMVDMQLINKKLHKRAERTLIELAGVTEVEAKTLLQKANYDLKTAIFIGMTKSDVAEAHTYIANESGHLKSAIYKYMEQYK
ncbi:N-acetylmuramic acid 6-phosphate etherase [Lederbergia lenta]|uniref:N-acetylmuramic acid 6-phosphate etherase n=1 Tax=Lederbergia lenta TaxID=1467 RepID=A0A2X4YSQ1_LEDLE|nr:N-acetylmuramic acid 6-phosphate etherase [Lederbergia lenta]MEC2326385.1 N-acetylmuramic acid 6-phosphate etherase [Lederbergia lenta]SQI51384.1 N-acetylmuramic acid-6-phosphate etherase [Lederbergia lenta]